MPHRSSKNYDLVKIGFTQTQTQYNVWNDVLKHVYIFYVIYGHFLQYLDYGCLIVGILS